MASLFWKWLGYGVSLSKMVSFLMRRIGIATPENNTKPATMSSFETKLPAELRLQIYGYVLRTESPLKRIKKGTSRKFQARTALLAVSKRVSHETTDLFYEQNIFMLNLADVVRVNGPQFELSIDAQQLDQKRYGDLQILCNADCGTESKRKSDLLRVSAALHVLGHLLKHQHSKLHTVLFRLGNNNFNTMTSALGNLMGTHRSSLVFTAVGHFEYTPRQAHEAKIAFEYPAMAAIWDYFANLEPGNPSLERHRLHPDHLEHLECERGFDMMTEAKVWLHAEYMARRVFESSGGKQKSWASVPHTTEKLKEITEYMARVL